MLLLLLWSYYLLLLRLLLLLLMLSQVLQIVKINLKLIDLNPEVYRRYSGGAAVERWKSGGRLQDSISLVFSHHMTSSNNM